MSSWKVGQIRADPRHVSIFVDNAHFKGVRLVGKRKYWPIRPISSVASVVEQFYKGPEDPITHDTVQQQITVTIISVYSRMSRAQTLTFSRKP